jgi:hypothetical protein
MSSKELVPLAMVLPFFFSSVGARQAHTEKKNNEKANPASVAEAGSGIKQWGLQS